MNAYLINIGDEILIGQTVNTNAAYIGQRLSENGFRVKKISSVADIEAEIIEEFQLAWETSDIIIVTGGLGPTHDDITKRCISSFFSAELVRDENVYNDVSEYFRKRNKPLTLINEEQALVPTGCIVVRNKKGTAPGMCFEKEGKFFISMPGVPFEMKSMVEEFVIPELREKFPAGKVIKMKNLLTAGIGESILYEKLGNVDALLNGAKLAFLPSQFGVKMRITVVDENQDIALNKISEVEQKIRALVGQHIYGVNDESMESIIVRLLLHRDLRIAVAESCTGGLITNRITDVPGSSQVFERGVVSYSNSSKVEMLYVNEDLIDKYGAVSSEVVMKMAAGVRSISCTDIGLAVSGIMGPEGGTPEKPVGTVYIGICDSNTTYSRKFVFGEDRVLNKERTSQTALDLLRKHLLGIQDND